MTRDSPAGGIEQMTQVPTATVQGEMAREVADALYRDAVKGELLSRINHAAYLGPELAKAERPIS